jgi:predicted HicB family RNase H-like nuclease
MRKKNLGGRPRLPTGKARGVLLAVRLQKDEHKQVVAAAKSSKMPLSAWVRGILLAAAQNAKISIPSAEDVGIEPHAGSGA